MHLLYDAMFLCVFISLIHVANEGSVLNQSIAQYHDKNSHVFG